MISAEDCSGNTKYQWKGGLLFLSAHLLQQLQQHITVINNNFNSKSFCRFYVLPIHNQSKNNQNLLNIPNYSNDLFCQHCKFKNQKGENSNISHRHMLLVFLILLCLCIHDAVSQT